MFTRTRALIFALLALLAVLFVVAPAAEATNVTSGMSITLSHGGSGTRDASGNLIWRNPYSSRAHGMAGFTQFDVANALSATIDEQDLSTINLDGSGTKALTNLVGFIVYEWVSGTGTVLIEPGDTNGATWHQTVTLGNTSTSVRFAVQPLTTGALVTSSLKTVDQTLTGTMVWRESIYAGSGT